MRNLIHAQSLRDESLCSQAALPCTDYRFRRIPLRRILSYTQLVKFLKTLVFATILLGISGVSRCSTARVAFAEREQSPTTALIRRFTGTITRNGDQFVLNDAKTHTLYQLDDQAAASKFEDKKVTVTGTLDAVKNIIRMQSIAEAAA